MLQTFTVETVKDRVQEVIEITIRCSPNLIQMGLEVAKVQVDEITRESSPPPPPTPQLEAQRSPELNDFIDAQWREKSTGPVLPHTGRF